MAGRGPLRTLEARLQALGLVRVDLRLALVAAGLLAVTLGGVAVLAGLADRFAGPHRVGLALLLVAFELARHDGALAADAGALGGAAARDRDRGDEHQRDH